MKNEIYIYGDIVGEKFFDGDTSAKEFAEQLSACDGEVVIHINSNGGDVLSAAAIANLIRQYKFPVNVIIDGVCASAATIISCAASSVTMASNALFMIHLPSIYLDGFKNEQDIEEIQKALAAVKNSILTIYSERLKCEFDEVKNLLDKEQWYTAEEALKAGFIDKISDAVNVNFDDSQKNIIINSINVKTTEYFKLKSKILDNKGESKMQNRTILAGLKAFLEGKSPAPVSNNDEIRTQELERIKNLNALRDENAAVDAIVDVAIREGESVEKVTKYIDAVKVAAKRENDESQKILSAFSAMIEDNLNSGAQGITNESNNNDVDKVRANAELIAKFANAAK